MVKVTQEMHDEGGPCSVSRVVDKSGDIVRVADAAGDELKRPGSDSALTPEVFLVLEQAALVLQKEIKGKGGELRAVLGELKRVVTELELQREGSGSDDGKLEGGAQNKQQRDERDEGKDMDEDEDSEEQASESESESESIVPKRAPRADLEKNINISTPLLKKLMGSMTVAEFGEKGFELSDLERLVLPDLHTLFTDFFPHFDLRRDAVEGTGAHGRSWPAMSVSDEDYVYINQSTFNLDRKEIILSLVKGEDRCAKGNTGQGSRAGRAAGGAGQREKQQQSDLAAGLGMLNHESVITLDFNTLFESDAAGDMLQHILEEWEKEPEGIGLEMELVYMAWLWKALQRHELAVDVKVLLSRTKG
eukprot:COSAG04_NODE_456_length_14055_cov_41.823660_13_plen_363_part_00